jgi:hypothetical protein
VPGHLAIEPSIPARIIMTKQQALERVASLSRKIAKGEMDVDSWKWRRAEAMAEASVVGATQREIAKAAGFKKGETASRHMAVWATYQGKPPANQTYSECYDAVTGFDREAAQERTDKARAQKFLASAPLEQVEQVISTLPKERQRPISAAAGNEYMKARQDYAEAEARLTPADLSAREAAADRLTAPVRNAAAGFTALGIVGHIEQATEELRELIADASLTEPLLSKIAEALADFTTEFEVARAMAGLEEATS